MNKCIALISFACCYFLAMLVACSSSKNATLESDGVAKKSDTASSEIFVDPRDGQVYRTVKIGKQTWMAENLNYKTADSDCLKDHDINCARFGRRYSWSAAMDSSATFTKNGEGCGLWESCSPTYPVQGVCPVGWHLPSRDEWKTLLSLLDEKDTAGYALRSKNAWRMRDHKGTDDYGFSVLPAEVDFYEKPYRNARVVADENTGFWSSTIFDDGWAYMLAFYNNEMSLDQNFKHMKYHVRCVKDEMVDSIQSIEPAKIPSDSVTPMQSMTDSRDGHVYRTVDIGDQTWMAENLSYDMAGSECWADEDSCDVRGRFYEWKNAKNACPVGWHLPSTAEWYALFSAVGGQRVAGKALRNKTGWDGCDDCKDEYGFSAITTGIAYSTAIIFDGDADFWSFAENDSNHAYFMFLKYNTNMARIIDRDFSMRSSIRCVKDGIRKVVDSTSLPVKAEKGVESFITDSRDGQTYKTVKIGEQTWMAENLNYDVPNKSYCYGKVPSNCAKYGRLYEGRVAMDACPAGFHLPSPSEWETLFNAVGGQFMAGSVLKSKKGWINDENGTDPFGFSAIPAGYGDRMDREEGKSANFWCSQVADDKNFYYVKLKYDGFNADMNYSENKAYSVRCVKD